MSGPAKQEVVDDRSIVFWSVNDESEDLSATTIAEAIGEYADALEEGEPLPETLTVHGYATMELPPARRMAETVLERMLEDLDEEYAAPDRVTKPTEAMQAAAEAFAEAVRKEYRAWWCERVVTRTVETVDYLTP